MTQEIIKKIKRKKQETSKSKNKKKKQQNIEVVDEISDSDGCFIAYVDVYFGSNNVVMSRFVETNEITDYIEDQYQLYNINKSDFLNEMSSVDVGFIFEGVTKTVF
jgi:hypothetical protein